MSAPPGPYGFRHVGHFPNDSRGFSVCLRRLLDTQTPNSPWPFPHRLQTTLSCGLQPISAFPHGVQFR